MPDLTLTATVIAYLRVKQKEAFINHIFLSQNIISTKEELKTFLNAVP